MTAETAAPTAAEPLTMDPATLTIDANVRAAVVLDKEFKASIKEHGVIVPVVVRLDPFGQYLVVDGQRRTLAAVEAGLTAVPVVLTAGISDDTDRVITQTVVNQQRAGLTAADQANAVKQLSLFGLSPTQIARKLTRPKAEVAAALAVAQAPDTVQTALAARPELDLTKAAVLTEFADDQDIVDELAAVAVEDPHGFDHEVQRVRNERAETALVAAKVSELEDRGVRVLDARPYNDKNAEDLDLLTDEPGAKGYPPRVDEAKHETTCPGHAVRVYVVGWGDERRARVDAYCMDWRTHGHFKRSARNTAGATSGEQPESLKAERRRVIENNKAAVAAETVRRRFITELLARPKLPVDAVVYAAHVLITDRTSHTDYGVRPILESFWLPSDPARVSTLHLLATTASPDAATKYLVALAAATVEHQMPKDFWRGSSKLVAAHLDQLAAWGYALSTVEHEFVETTAGEEASRG